MEPLSQREVLEILTEGFFSNIGKKVGSVKKRIQTADEKLGKEVNKPSFLPKVSGGILGAGYKAAKGLGSYLAPELAEPLGKLKGGVKDVLGAGSKGYKKTGELITKADMMSLPKDKLYAKLLDKDGYVLDTSTPIKTTPDGKYDFFKARFIRSIDPKTGKPTLDPNIEDFRAESENPTGMINLSRKTRPSNYNQQGQGKGKQGNKGQGQQPPQGGQQPPQQSQGQPPQGGQQPPSQQSQGQPPSQSQGQPPSQPSQQSQGQPPSQQSQGQPPKQRSKPLPPVRRP